MKKVATHPREIMARNMYMHMLGLLSASLVDTTVAMTPRSYEASIKEPFDMASLTGYVSSTEKL